VGEVRLMHGSTDEEFDESVIEAIREWRFSPAVRKGQKVRCWVEQALIVKLSGGTAFEVN
jgi:TonB family protein